MSSDLPLNYTLAANANQSEGQNDGNSGQNIHRSLSQTLLYQMSSPTFGLSGRSTSPSLLLSNQLRRTPSLTNRIGYMSQGTSLQSLVKSFINKVSRGTQTDCDDNFDAVSIASMASGFSAVASDLTRSRLKLLLNDKTSGSSQADDSEFVEELQKLRDEIDGRFGVLPTENEFAQLELEASIQKQTSDYSKVSCENKSEEVKLTCDKGVETDQPDTEEISTQTETQPPDHIGEATPEVDDGANENEDEEVVVVALVSECAVQTSPPPSPPPSPQIELRSISVEYKPQVREIETQTESWNGCNHCSAGNLSANQPETDTNSAPPSPTKPSTDSVIRLIEGSNQPMIKCEFHISHADIISKEKNGFIIKTNSSKESNASLVNSGTDFAQAKQVEETVVQKKSQSNLASAPTPVNGSSIPASPNINSSNVSPKSVASRSADNNHVHRFVAHYRATVGGQKDSQAGGGIANGGGASNRNSPLPRTPNGKNKSPKSKKGKIVAEDDANHAQISQVEPKCCTVS